MRPDLQPEKMRVLNSWRLGPALTGELGFDPPIKSLFVYNANPVAIVSDQTKLEHGLERDDLFTVVSEHFPTDTASTPTSCCRRPPSWNRKTSCSRGGSLSVLQQCGDRAARRSGAQHRAVPSPGESHGHRGSVLLDSESTTRRSRRRSIGPILSCRALSCRMSRRTAMRGSLCRRPPTGRRTATEIFRHPRASASSSRPSPAAAISSWRCSARATTATRDGHAGGPLAALHSHETLLCGRPLKLAKRYPLSLISPKSHAFLNSNYGNLPAQTAQAGEEQAVFLHPDDAEQRGIVAGVPILRVQRPRCV